MNEIPAPGSTPAPSATPATAPATPPAPAAPTDPYAKRPAAPAPVSGVSDMDRNVDAMMAAPSKPTGYKISVAGALDPGDVAEVCGALHARGCSQGDLDTLLVVLSGVDRDPSRNLQPEVHERKTLDALRRKWGDSFDENIRYAQSEGLALIALSPKFEAWLSDKRLGSNQRIVERLAARGRYRASRNQGS